MKTRLIALIAFTAVVAAACSTGLSEQRALTGAAPAGPGGTSVEIPNREDRPQQPGRPALGENARPYVETLELSIEDIQAFWTTKMPKVFGQEFEPIPNDKIFAYSQNNPPPACGTGQQPSADDLVGNAFYCSEGGFIAFDDENLFPKLYKNFGSYAVAMVLAHEWGHAVQDQMGISGGNVPTVYLEQQADCFAGAWTKWVDDGDSPNLSLSPGSLDAALGGMLEFRDEPGTNPNDGIRRPFEYAVLNEGPELGSFDLSAQVRIGVPVPGLGPVLGETGPVVVGASHAVPVDLYRAGG